MIKVVNTASAYASLYYVADYCKAHDTEEIQIIVPDKLSLFMEKFLFEQMNISASFNIKVATLNRFAKKKCVIAKEQQISKVGSILLINKILNDNIDNLKAIKSKVYSFTYAENIFKTIIQLKASKIGWQEMQMFESSDEQLKNKILDLSLVYEQYETLKAGLLDASDMFLMSTLYVAEGFENRNILFVGFDDFTAIEYSIIEQLALSNRVSVITNYGNGSNKHIFNNEIYSQLKNIAYVNQIDIQVENAEQKFSDLKTFLNNNLFGVENNKFILNNETVKVFKSNKIDEDIEFVARDIRHNIINGGKYSDFGVAVFDVEKNINKIQEVFNKYEINYYIDSELSLNKSIFYKFLISILKYNIESYNLAHLIDIINSPFFELDKTEKQKLIDRFISLNFKGKITQNLNLGEDLLKQQEVLTNFLELFTIDETQPNADIIEALKQAFRDVEVDRVIENILLNIDLQNKILLKKSKDVIYTLFDEILMFNENVNLHQFLDIVLHISSVVKISNLPLGLDVVKVVDANNTLEIFNNLYIVNCTSNTAPALKYDCGIILDTEIDKLNFSKKLNPTIAHINKLAKLRLFNVAMQFENNLTITCSEKPSDLINEMLNKIQVSTSAGVFNIVPITNFAYDKYVALSKWDFIEYLTKFEKNNKKLLENNIKNKEIINISKNNLNIFNNLKEISATTLENYFKCPFYGFLQNTLSIKPRIESQILSFDIGNILHEIMFKYYKLKKQVGDLYAFCRDEIFNFVDRNERLKLNANSPILVSLIDEAVRILNAVNYMDDNSSFVPKKFEYEFKGDSALKLKNINIKGKIDRIDEFNDLIRIIDYKSGKVEASLKELYYGNKLQLFLYSCAVEEMLNKHMVGNFYMPLHNAYTKEVENTYSLKGYFINEDFVLKAMDNRLDVGLSSDILDVTINKEFKAGRTKGVKKLESDEMLNLKQYSKHISEQAVDEIKSGYIAPSPSELSNPCEYCPYVHICLKQCNNIPTRSANKIDVSSFKEVGDE